MSAWHSATRLAVEFHNSTTPKLKKKMVRPWALDRKPTARLLPSLAVPTPEQRQGPTGNMTLKSNSDRDALPDRMPKEREHCQPHATYMYVHARVPNTHDYTGWQCKAIRATRQHSKERQLWSASGPSPKTPTARTVQKGKK